MLLHSEVEAQAIIPFLRTTVAKILIDKHSLTQQQSAKKMGITQATISNYMNRSRGNIELYLITERIQSYAEQIADEIINEMKSDGYEHLIQTFDKYFGMIVDLER